ncbi:MAG TPA: hypothetical protein VGK74_24370 [Symbiobacteriaceae bacterium]
MRENQSWHIYRNGAPLSTTVTPPGTPLWPGTPMTPPAGSPKFGMVMSLDIQSDALSRMQPGSPWTPKLGGGS